MRLAPITASAIAQASARVGCSRSQAAAMPQAKTGLSDTRTTELATVVNRSDALHAPPARVARRDIAPRPYGRGSARSPRSVAVRPDWSLGHTLSRAPHRRGRDRRPVAAHPTVAPERRAARARDRGYPAVEPRH